MKRLSIVMIVLMTALNLSAKDKKAEAETAKDEKTFNVLFIGNSYTAAPRGAFKKLLAASPYKNSDFQYICPGGCTLVRHSKDPKVIEKINEKKWDYVVLQDQSQTPGIPNAKPGFLKASEELCALIKEVGAKPVFYMTWGRRDGDKRNQALYPDYKTMQKRLTDAYEEAAKKNEAMMAPVGLVWSDARDALKDDYAVLYSKDGSHPGGKGNFLIACVFFKTLFKSDLDFVKPADDQEKLIKEVVLKHK